MRRRVPPSTGAELGFHFGTNSQHWGGPFKLLLLEWASPPIYPCHVPHGLTRYHHSGQSHFITFSTYHRIPHFAAVASRTVVELALERVRRLYQLYVYGYVVMPDHLHLLLSEPVIQTVAVA